MKSTSESSMVGLFVVGILIAVASSASAVGIWEHSLWLYFDTDYENDPNGNGGPGTLVADPGGDGGDGASSAWVDIYVNTQAAASASVSSSFGNPPVRAQGFGRGWGGAYGWLMWRGEGGQGGSKTVHFQAHSHGEASGATGASDFTSGGSASASATSESTGVADSDKAGVGGNATFSEYSSASSGVPSTAGSCNGYAEVDQGNGSSSATGSESWQRWEDREEASWTVSAEGYQYNLTGGTVSSSCHANSEARVEAYVAPGTISYGSSASASGDAAACAHVYMTLN